LLLLLLLLFLTMLQPHACNSTNWQASTVVGSNCLLAVVVGVNDGRGGDLLEDNHHLGLLCPPAFIRQFHQRSFNAYIIIIVVVVVVVVTTTTNALAYHVEEEMVVVNGKAYAQRQPRGTSSGSLQSTQSMG